MDILELYQEEAAKSMEISRPTFTRILKNARQKLTRALVYGNKISIEDANTAYIIAICSASKDNFESILSTDQYIFIYKVENSEVTLIKLFESDVFLKKQKPAIVLPQIFLQFNVNIFLSTRIGEGVKNSLLAKGIQTIEKQIESKEDLIGLLSS
jgi:predicted Fe-Mo cluster-binding NifX family protein